MLRNGSAKPAAPKPTALDEVVRSHRAVQIRVGELEVANKTLQRQIGLEARRLQTVMRELVLAAERTGAEPLAGAMRVVASWQADLSFRANGEPLAGQCRALAPMARLSARELEVLRLLTEGSRSPCIALQLGISAATVEVHRRNIMRKVGLHCVADLTKYAVRQGLTPL